jgi:hypothetical protein
VGLRVKGEMILRRVLNRNIWWYFEEPQDCVSDTPQNDNRP